MCDQQSKKDGNDQETIESSTKDTTWESNKNTVNITNKSQEVSHTRSLIRAFASCLIIL